MTLSTFITLCNHYLFLVPKYLSPHKEAPDTLSELLPILLSLQPLATTSVRSVSMALPTVDISSKWNQLTCGLLCQLLSHSIMLSGFIDNIACIPASFLFQAERVILWIYHNLFIRSSVMDIWAVSTIWL